MMIYEYIILETALFPARSIAAAHDHDDPTYDSLAYKDTEPPSNSIINLFPPPWIIIEISLAPARSS